AAQLVVDQWQQLRGGVRVALLDGRQDARHLGHGRRGYHRRGGDANQRAGEACSREGPTGRFLGRHLPGRSAPPGQDRPKRRLNCPLSWPSTSPSPSKSKYHRYPASPAHALNADRNRSRSAPSTSPSPSLSPNSRKKPSTRSPPAAPSPSPSSSRPQRSWTWSARTVRV